MHSESVSNQEPRLELTRWVRSVRSLPENHCWSYCIISSGDRESPLDCKGLIILFKISKIISYYNFLFFKYDIVKIHWSRFLSFFANHSFVYLYKFLWLNLWFYYIIEYMCNYIYKYKIENESILFHFLNFDHYL